MVKKNWNILRYRAFKALSNDLFTFDQMIALPFRIDTTLMVTFYFFYLFYRSFTCAPHRWYARVGEFRAWKRDTHSIFNNVILVLYRLYSTQYTWYAYCYCISIDINLLFYYFDVWTERNSEEDELEWQGPQ